MRGTIMDINSAVQKSPLPDRIYITRSALQVIQAEAGRHSDIPHRENETGGILVGRRLAGVHRVELLVVAATGPGERAYHNPVEFNPDVEYVNQKLKEYHALYPLMDYIGTWHKHPLSYQMFSEGDMRTAHNIFDDSSYKLDEIVNPIVWVDQGDFTIRYYYMSRAMAERGERFAEIPPANIRQIDDNHDLVIKEQRGAAAEAVPDRIGAEYRHLAEQGYQVELRQHEQEYFFTIHVPDQPDLAIHLVAPAGYPQAPPSLFVERNGQEIATGDGGVISRWGSSADRPRLADVVAGVVSSLAVPPPLPQPAAAPTNGQPPERGDGRLSFVAVGGGVAALLLAVIGFSVWQLLVPGRAIDSRITATAVSGQADTEQTVVTRQVLATHTAATRIAAAHQAAPQTVTAQVMTATTAARTATAQAIAQAVATATTAAQTTAAQVGVVISKTETSTVTATMVDTAAPGVTTKPTAISTPTITTSSIIYTVDVQEISLERMHVLVGGTICEQCNVYLDSVPQGIRMGLFTVEGEQPVGEEFSIEDGRLRSSGTAPVLIKVVFDSSAKPIKTIGSNRIDPDKFYTISVMKE